MATKSILKHVEIENENACKHLITALEASVLKSSKHVILSVPYREIHNNDIKKFFKNFYLI